MKTREQLERELAATEIWIERFEQSLDEASLDIENAEMYYESVSSQLESLREEAEIIRRELGLDNEPGV